MAGPVDRFSNPYAARQVPGLPSRRPAVLTSVPPTMVPTRQPVRGPNTTSAVVVPGTGSGNNNNGTTTKVAGTGQVIPGQRK